MIIQDIVFKVFMDCIGEDHVVVHRFWMRVLILTEYHVLLSDKQIRDALYRLRCLNFPVFYVWAGHYGTVPRGVDWDNYNEGSYLDRVFVS